jgi:hypothetical protein
MRGRSRQVAPKATPCLQFVVRTEFPAGDRAFFHGFQEGAALSRFGEQSQSSRFPPADGFRYLRKPVV